MPHDIALWSSLAIDKCGQHGISQDDFEFVIFSASVGTERPSHIPHRVMIDGYTEDRRAIRCVFERIDGTTIFPITAHNLED